MKNTVIAILAFLVSLPVAGAAQNTGQEVIECFIARIDGVSDTERLKCYDTAILNAIAASRLNDDAGSKRSTSGKASDLTIPQKNAVRSAQQYLSWKGFSRLGLIDQLSAAYGEAYEVNDATIAVDSLSINWREQAVKSAEQYLKFQGFSCNGLVEQLSSSTGEKFTREEAIYGAERVGLC